MQCVWQPFSLFGINNETGNERRRGWGTTVVGEGISDNKKVLKGDVIPEICSIILLPLQCWVGLVSKVANKTVVIKLAESLRNSFQSNGQWEAMKQKKFVGESRR